jgi:hypothetical protein
MKKTFVIWCMLYWYANIFAQNHLFDIVQVDIDTIVKEFPVSLNHNKEIPFPFLCRERADSVLSVLDYIKETKLLFSVNNQYFYIIIDDTLNYKEIFISFKNEKINHCYFIKNKYGLIKSKYEKQLMSDRKNLLSNANPFDLKQYHNEFITDLDKAISYFGHSYGQPAYFVIKDTSGNRYGEIGLYSFVFGKNMNVNLIWYLNFRLWAEMRKNHL